MGMFSTFIYSGGILVVILVLLFLVPKLNVFLKKRQSKKKKEVKVVEVKREVHRKKIIVSKRDLIKAMIWPFVLVVLLGLFLIFESNIVNFVKGYAIELAPINYISLFTLLGLIFITKGAILTLGNNVNNRLKSFVWIMHGFVLTVVALFYDLLNLGHVELFGINFSWLIVLLAVWEVVVLVSIVGNYKKVF